MSTRPKIRGPGVTFTKPPREPFNWAPVVAIASAILAALLAALVACWPLLMTKGLP